MSSTIKLESINTSPAKGTKKTLVTRATLDHEGIVGDAHRNTGIRSLSLLSKEEIDSFAQTLGRKLLPGEFGENMTTQGLDLRTIRVLDRLKIGEQAVIEFTQRGKSCHNGGCSIFQQVGNCIMPKWGLFAQVITPGEISCGDDLTYLPKKLKVAILTLSDRAYRGEYEDLSGPLLEGCLKKHDFMWPLDSHVSILPDDPVLLREKLEFYTQKEEVDIIFTTGGTGLGPRDITPDVISSFIDKEIPSLMEAIRLHYGKDNPKALLSRSVAGLKGKTFIYALPGSTKAVSEYMGEILKTLEHLILMVHGLGH